MVAVVLGDSAGPPTALLVSNVMSASAIDFQSLESWEPTSELTTTGSILNC